MSSTSFPTIYEEQTLHRCQNCEREWNKTKMEQMGIRDFFQRVTVGEPVPSGECPACGALCQPVPVGQTIDTLPNDAPPCAYWLEDRKERKMQVVLLRYKYTDLFICRTVGTSGDVTIFPEDWDRYRIHTVRQP